MLIRLHVKGFKNLVDTEIRLGPITYIAGLNGVGKSNLFDAIRFLALLADTPFVEAASQIRGGEHIEDLFSAGGDGLMHFSADVLIPTAGVDAFNQPAKASRTFLTYELALRLDRSEGGAKVHLISESLSSIKKSDAKERLGFAHEQSWRESVDAKSSRRAPYISTVTRESGVVVVRLSSDRTRSDLKSTSGGRPRDFSINSLPRTVLSSAQNAEETSTAVLLRQEMRRWRMLQLEPSALRKPSKLTDPEILSAEGEHLPRVLYRLASASANDADAVYAQVAKRLMELVDEVRGLRVDRDDGRRILRVLMRDREGVELPASSLSDGTLRFLALTVLEADPTTSGLLCLEEPENGIHPERIGATLALLQDMAVDPMLPVGEDNPLRQIIVSTHSPIVASAVGEAELVFATRKRAVDSGGRRYNTVNFEAISGTWRAAAGSKSVLLGQILAYLGAAEFIGEAPINPDERPVRRYVDDAVRQLKLGLEGR